MNSITTKTVATTTITIIAIIFNEEEAQEKKSDKQVRKISVLFAIVTQLGK